MERRESRLGRRELVLGMGAVGVGAAGLGLVAGWGRLPWQPEPPAKVSRIGFLVTTRAQTWHEAFRQGLRERGYVDGENISIEYRFAEGDFEQLPDLAAELIHLPVDVIFAVASPSAVAARQASSTIPIVFAISGDPVEEGLVSSLARPGGNVTGVSGLNAPLSGKRLQLLKDTLPTAGRVAVLWNPDNPADAAAWGEMEGAAPILGLQLQFLAIRASDALDPRFLGAGIGEVDALVVTLPALAPMGRMAPIVEFASEARLPAIYPVREAVDAGGLMAYGASWPVQFRRSAYYVDRILKGAKPADLPVEQPREFEFVVNMRTARELGITFPNEIMLQVTEVVP